MVYIPCLAFLLLGHVLRPSWDLEKKKLFVGTCFSSFLGFRKKKILLEHDFRSSWDLEKFSSFCGQCTST